MWVEVNQRVVYPIKEILVAFVHQGILDLEDNRTAFCYGTNYSQITTFAHKSHSVIKVGQILDIVLFNCNTKINAKIIKVDHNYINYVFYKNSYYKNDCLIFMYYFDLFKLTLK